ncbi:spindle pole body component 110-like [Cryptomeria japonica]|uniref:spindle pole body component 110-like n=1 Tax=Cryptomeria japonica TaxID=3369 RepID=UPI0027DAA00F|nr:spindle pole body component 110-like [Cryptomeria japonica]
MPKTIPIDPDGKREYENDAKDKHVILCGLSKEVFVKIRHCGSSKEVWDKLNNIYYGNDKVKQANILTLREKFEGMKMTNEEKVADYFLRVDETVNAIRGLGETIDDKDVIEKVMRSLPTKYDSKLSVIEELKDLNTLTMDELHGTLTSYKMRTCNEETSHRENAFKTEKKNKKIKSKSENDIEEANFVRKLKKGAGKYKDKLPFKCFNCGKIGDITDNNSKESIYGEEKVLFMSTECSVKKQSDNDVILSELESENEVDLEGELICALKEVKRLKKEICAQKDQATTLTNKIGVLEPMVTDLTRQDEEHKRIEDVIKTELAVKNESYKKLEAEIVSLKRKLEKYDNTRLEDILSKQRKVKNIPSLGFEVGQSSSANNNKTLYDIFSLNFKTQRQQIQRRTKKAVQNRTIRNSYKIVIWDL